MSKINGSVTVGNNYNVNPSTSKPATSANGEDLAKQLAKLNQKDLQSLIAKLGDEGLQQLEDEIGAENLAALLSQFDSNNTNLVDASPSITINLAAAPENDTASPDLPAIPPGEVITAPAARNLAIILSDLISNIIQSIGTQTQIQGETRKSLLKFERFMAIYSAQTKLSTAETSFKQADAAAKLQKDADETKVREHTTEAIKSMVSAGVGLVSAGVGIGASKLAQKFASVKESKQELKLKTDEFDQKIKDRKSNFSEELTKQHERLEQQKQENTKEINKLNLKKNPSQEDKAKLAQLEKKQKNLDKMLKQNEKDQKDFKKGKLSDQKQYKIIEQNMKAEQKELQAQEEWNKAQKDKLNKIKQDIPQAEDDLNKLKQTKAQTEIELKQAQKELDDMTSTRALPGAMIPDETFNDAHTKVNELSTKLNKNEIEVNKCTNKLNDLKIQQDAIEKKLARLGNNSISSSDYNNMLKELTDYNKKMDQLETKIDQYKQIIRGVATKSTEILNNTATAWAEFNKTSLKAEETEQDYQASFAKALTDITRTTGENSVTTTSTLDDQLKESLRAKNDEILQALATVSDTLGKLLQSLQTSNSF